MTEDFCRCPGCGKCDGAERADKAEAELRKARRRAVFNAGQMMGLRDRLANAEAELSRLTTWHGPDDPPKTLRTVLLYQWGTVRVGQWGSPYPTHWRDLPPVPEEMDVPDICAEARHLGDEHGECCGYCHGHACSACCPPRRRRKEVLNG